MESAQELTEDELLDAGADVLRERLPATWRVENASPGPKGQPRALLIEAPAAGARQFIDVETKGTVSSRDVHLLLGGPWRRRRPERVETPTLVIGRYIGSAARRLLSEEGINYLDLTGNVRLQLDHPGLFLDGAGAQRDPALPRAARRGLRGGKAGMVVRVLIEARPPYAGGELANAARVSEGYVSRLLETLDDEGLITRERFGPVTDVDWEGLLRRRAQVVDLLAPDRTRVYLSSNGVQSTLRLLAERGREFGAAVTGSFAAYRLAPVAAPTLLVVYAESRRRLAEQLELLPTDEGSDVALLKPKSAAVTSGAKLADGVRWVAPAQVALDCLSGRARMPAEGEAVVQWMRGHEDSWRYRSLVELQRAWAAHEKQRGD